MRRTRATHTASGPLAMRASAMRASARRASAMRARVRRLAVLVATLGATAACASSGASVQTVGGRERETQQGLAGATAEAERTLAGRQAVATIAVLPFEAADSSVDDLALGFAELIATDLGRFPALRLLERARLDEVLQEQRLDTARIDPTTAVRLGRLIAAQQLVRGTMAGTGDTAITFDVGLVDVGTSQLRAAYSGQAGPSGIFAAERLVVQRLARELGVEVPPEVDARMAARESFPIEAFRSFARGVRHEADGELGAAVEAYAKASGLAPTFDVATARGSSAKQRMVEKAKSVPTARDRRRPRPARPATRPPG